MVPARDKHGGLVTADIKPTTVDDLGPAPTVLDSRAGFELVGSFLDQCRRDSDLSRRSDRRRLGVVTR